MPKAWYIISLLQGGLLQTQSTNTMDRAIRFLLVSTLLALLAGYAILSFPSRKDTLDFSQFYAAGEIVRQGRGHELYDLNTQFQLQSRLARVHTFYSHPPFEAMGFVPFTFAGYRTAYALWTLLGMGLLIASAGLIDSSAHVSATLSQYLRFPADRGLVIVLFATFSPVTTCLLIGQDSMPLLLVFSLVYWLLSRNREFAAGCVLACGLFKFQFVIPFALVLLCARCWRALRGFSLAGAILIGLSLAISGRDALSTYPRLLFQEKIFQTLGDLAYVPNIRGLLAMFFSHRASPIFMIAVAAFSVIVLWIAARNWRQDRLPLSFSCALFAALLASYHLYTYDLSLLLLPIALLLTEVRGLRPSLPRQLPAFFFGCVLLLFIPPLHLWLIVHRLYVLMVIPIAGLFATSLQLSRATGKASLSAS